MTTIDRSPNENSADNAAGPRRENPYERNVMTAAVAGSRERKHYLDISQQWFAQLPLVVAEARIETPDERRKRGAPFKFNWPEHPGECWDGFSDHGYPCDCDVFEDIASQFDSGYQVPPTFVEAGLVEQKRKDRREQMLKAQRSFAAYLRWLSRKHGGKWFEVPELNLKGDYRAFGRWYSWEELPKNCWWLRLSPRRFYTAWEVEHYGRQPFPDEYEPFVERLYTFEEECQARAFAEEVLIYLKERHNLWLLVQVEGIQQPHFQK